MKDVKQQIYTLLQSIICLEISKRNNIKSCIDMFDVKSIYEAAGWSNHFFFITEPPLYCLSSLQFTLITVFFFIQLTLKGKPSVKELNRKIIIIQIQYQDRCMSGNNFCR